jgi:photosystem II stability/assembly factor-like uncharacterized protein
MKFSARVGACAALLVGLTLATAVPAKPAAVKGPSGYVLLRVAKNTALVGRQARDFTTVTVSSVGETARSWRLALLPGGDRTRTFGALLPEGTYRLRALEAPGIEATDFVTIPLAPPANLGTFQVRAGELAWLDTLMFQPLGAGEATLVPVASGVDGRALLTRLAPDMVPSLADKPPGGWQRPDAWGLEAKSLAIVGPALRALVANKHDRDYLAPANATLRGASTEAELLALMKKMPGQINGGYLHEDGTALYGSSFGQIWKRAIDGTWSTLDTGCVCDILSVTVVEHAIYAGTEFGSVLRSTDDGKSFGEVARLPNDDGVAHVDFLSNGEWMVSAQRVDSAKKTQRRSFYLVGDLARLASSQPLHTFEEEFHRTYGEVSMTVPLSAGPVPGGFAILEAPNQLHRFEAARKTWQVTAIPVKRVERLSFTHSGSVLFSEDAALQSTDGGATWSRIDGRMFPMYLSAMFDATTGLQMVWYPQSIRSADLYYTADGGKSWKMTGERDGTFCPAFGVNELRRQVYCLGHDAVIHATERGEQWTQEAIAR